MITAVVEKALLKKLLNFFFVVFMFLCTANKMLSFPVDKAVMVVLILAIILFHVRRGIFTEERLIVLSFLFILPMLSSIANLSFVPMIFFPLIGFFFSILLSKDKHLIFHSLYYALFIHIIIGLFFAAQACLQQQQNAYVFSMAEKGLPFIFSPKGFTATVQTYGTLCILWVLIFFLRKKAGANSKTDFFLFAIVSLAVLSTMNRSTYLFWIIVLFFKMRKLFWSIMMILVAFIIRFWESIVLFLGNKSSITSRSELLEGFNASFWKSNSLLVYIFGRGNNYLPPQIVARAKWDNRSDIENGYAMILHAYGFLGLLFFVVLGVSILWRLLITKNYSYSIIFIYFFFVAPYFTQEFVSGTFYLFLATFLWILHQSKQERPTVVGIA